MGVLNRLNIFKGIRRKLLGYFLILTILPLGILSYTAFNNGRVSTEERVMAHLTSIADMKKSEIEGWLEERIANTKDHANNNILIEYLQHGFPKAAPHTEEEKLIESSVFSLLEYYQENYAYKDIYVIDTTGLVVASTSPDHMGDTLTSDIIRTSIESNDIRIKDIHKTANDLYEMEFCYPIVVKENTNSKTALGAILIKINMEDTLYPVIRSWPGMGETGETLLARIEDDNVVFINELRHSTHDPLTLKVPVNSEFANPAQYATEGQSATIKALDYRGVEVVSAYRNIPLMNWGFVAKIDQTEAFFAVNQLLNKILISSFLVILFAVSLAYLASDRFTSRIIEIEQTTQEISRGIFAQSIHMNTDDEIGSLAASVNQMSAQLQKTIEMERKLTESIAEANARERYQLRLRELYEHTIELFNHNNEEEVAKATLDILASSMQSEYLTFLKVEEDHLRVLYSRGGPLTTLKLPLDGKSVTVKTVHERESQIIGDTRAEPDYYPGFKDSLSEIAVPILVGDEVYGIIDAESTELDKFDGQDQRLIEFLSLNVSSAIARIRAQEIRDRMYEQLVVEQMKTEQAMELERLKTNFMSTATHEIRTPLTSIRGYSELIQEEFDKDTKPDIKYYFEVIQKNIDRLRLLTDDLLDLQRIESGRLHLEKKVTSMDKLIAQVQEEMQPILEGKNQQLVIQNDSETKEIVIDEMRIMQVLINYVSNANKYSDDGKEIKIIIQDNPEGLRIKVVDEGIGLSEVDIGKLFKPFPDIDMDHVRRGTGLGLSICKGIIELHGGTVDVESAGKGMGSTFSFEIPVTS